MKPIRRRRFLGTLSFSGALGFAGCSLRDLGESTPSATPTATLDDLSFAAEVVEQRSTDAPATIRATLTNRGDGVCRIGTGETIVPRYEDGPGYDVLLLPETSVGPNDRPEEPVDGCWRYTDDDFLSRDIIEWHDLTPGDSLGETYGLLTRGEESPCLPAGEYGFVDTVRSSNRDDDLTVRVAVSIAGGDVSVRGTVERS